MIDIIQVVKLRISIITLTLVEVIDRFKSHYEYHADMDKRILPILLLTFMVLVVGCNGQDIKPSASIEQTVDSNEKIVVVNEPFEIILKISAWRDDYLKENAILITLYDKPYSKYSSPFGGKMLNLEDYFDIIEIDKDWRMERVTDNSDYEVIDSVSKYSPGIYSRIFEEGYSWLLLNEVQTSKNKELNFILKPKQAGKYTLVMSQMNAKTGFVNICVGTTNEVAEELCKDYLASPTSTEEPSILTTD